MISDVSTFESITCKIEWKLYDLDKHEQFMQNGQYLTSIFVSLVQVGLDVIRTVKTKFNIYTLDDDGNKNFCCPSTFSVFKYQTESNKYQVFKSQTTTDNSNDILEDGKDYVLVDDSTEALNLDFLLIFCEVEFVPYDIECEKDVLNYSSGATSQLSLKMFKEGILTDCVIEVILNCKIKSKGFWQARSQDFLKGGVPFFALIGRP